MDFKIALSSDSSRRMIETIVSAIGDSVEYFEEVLNISYTAKGMPSSRAARVIDLYIEKNPSFGKLYSDDIAKNIIRLEDSRTKRSLCRILTRHLPQIPEVLEQLINFAFEEIYSRKAPVALKVYAVETLFNISKQIPEIREELILTIESELNKNSSAFKSKGVNTLKKLRKNLHFIH